MEGQKSRCLLMEVPCAAVPATDAACGNSSGSNACPCHSSSCPQVGVWSEQADVRCFAPYLHVRVHLVPRAEGKHHAQGYF